LDFCTSIFAIQNGIANFTVIGSSFLPVPTAITFPRCGFSFAVSGMIIPPAVFSSAAAAS
jgi:hypothetical protein